LLVTARQTKSLEIELFLFATYFIFLLSIVKLNIFSFL
jgi:hypothetical protein